MKEEWRPVPWHTIYEVSNFGRIRCFRKQDKHLHSKRAAYGFGAFDEGYIVEPTVHRLGYLYVILSSFGRQDKWYVHQLVARAFLPNPRQLSEVNHIDANKQNNCVWNLEWCTRQENVRHAMDMGLYDEGWARARKLVQKPVYCYETGLVYPSGTDAAEALGLFKSQVSLVCQRKARHAGGYHFCYEDDVDVFIADIDKIKAGEHAFRPVRAMNLETGEQIVFGSRGEASKALGIPDSYISNIIAGRSYKTRGWTFEDARDIYEYS